MKKQRARKKGRKDKSRKLYFLVAALVIVIVGSLVGWVLLAQVSFEEAIQKPELRDSYIEKIIEEIGKSEGIVINYDDTPEELEFLREEYGRNYNPRVLMSTHLREKIIPGQLGKRFLPERISIYPSAFSGETIKTEVDFLSCLLHEYRHVQQAREDRIGRIKVSTSFLTLDGKWNENLFLAIREMDAIRIELKQPKISTSYRNNRMSLYLDTYEKIWHYQKGMKAGFIKTLKIEFFQPWILKTPYLFRERRGEREIWYIQNPKTGQKFYLPEEVIARYSKLKW